MTPDQTRTILENTLRMRDEARAMLDQLQQTKLDLDSRLSAKHAEDAMRIVTGRSAIDNAIESSRRMLDRLERSMAKAGVSVTRGALDAVDRPRHRAGHDDDSLRVETVRAALAAVESGRSLPATR